LTSTYAHNISHNLLCCVSTWNKGICFTDSCIPQMLKSENDIKDTHVIFWISKYCNVFGCITRLITSLCLGCSGYLLSFIYTRIQSLLLSLYLSGGYLPSLPSMATRLRLLSVFRYSLWWLMQDSSLASSVALDLCRCSADRIWDTILQGSISRVRQSIASETSRLIRCYSTDNPLLWYVTVGTQQFPL
jgi:hypothetical protein